VTTDDGAQPEWFDRPDPDTGETGLRFSCTQCGRCCSGAPGEVFFTEAEGLAIARALGVEYADFLSRYTRRTARGPSIRDVAGPHGYDCVFLDRESRPGLALCSVYGQRPAQCRTWPFWPSLLGSRDDWIRAHGTCPGLGRGPLHTPVQVRVVRSSHPR
jgi:uncharacterized protein